MGHVNTELGATNLSIALRNGPRSFVVAGTPAGIQRLELVLRHSIAGERQTRLTNIRLLWLNSRGGQPVPYPWAART